MVRARLSSAARLGLSLLLGCVSVLAGPARAQTAPPAGGTTLHILSGVATQTTWPPIRKPYFPGWTALVTPHPEFFKLPKEPGGVGVDAVTGWIYAGSRDGHIVCVNGGKQLWSVDVGGALLAPPTVFRNVLVAGTEEGVLYVLNKVTGERKARSILGEELITQPVVLDDGNGHARAYVGSSAESIFAVDIEDGLKSWRVHRDPPSGFTIYGFARPLVTPTAIYAGFADGTVESIDPVTGVSRWEKHLSPSGDMLDVDSVVFNGESVFAASYSGGVFSLDPRTGDIRWQTKIPQVNHLITDGRSVYAGAPGLWSSLRADDGVVTWRFQFGKDSGTSAPVLMDSLLIFAEQDGPLYFVDKRSGEGLGILSPGEGFSSPPALFGRVLFALSNYGRVYSAILAP